MNVHAQDRLSLYLKPRLSVMNSIFKGRQLGHETMVKGKHITLRDINTLQPLRFRCLWWQDVRYAL